MKSFKNYIITEADTKAAFEMETSIVNAANKDTHTSKMITKEAAQNIIRFLNSKGISGKGKMPASMYATNPSKWDKYFPGGRVPGATKTPKTDLIIGRSNISLKTGPAQLTSGGKGEASALFFNAIEQTGKRPDKLVSSIRDGISKIAPSTLTSVKGGVRDVLKSKKDEVLNKANELNKRLKEEIKNLFSSGGSVPIYFTQEAISGDIKFNHSEGAADYILVTDFKGQNNRLHRTNDKKYVNKIASQVKPDVRFKSVSEKIGGKKTGRYRYWGVVSLITEEVIDNDFNMLMEEFEHEGLLKEGIFDTIKQKGGEILDRINNVIDKLKDKITEYFMRAINYIKDSWDKVLEFFDLEVDISHRNYVQW